MMVLMDPGSSSLLNTKEQCFVFLSVWTFKSCPVCVCMCVGEDKYALVSVFILVCMEAKGQHQESFSIFLHLSF